MTDKLARIEDVADKTFDYVIVGESLLVTSRYVATNK